MIKNITIGEFLIENRFFNSVEKVIKFLNMGKWLYEGKMYYSPIAIIDIDSMTQRCAFCPNEKIYGKKIVFQSVCSKEPFYIKLNESRFEGFLTENQAREFLKKNGWTLENRQKYLIRPIAICNRSIDSSIKENIAGFANFRSIIYNNSKIEENIFTTDDKEIFSSDDLQWLSFQNSLLIAKKMVWNGTWPNDAVVVPTGEYMKVI